MENKSVIEKISSGQLLYIRKLNKAGGSRYLSVGKILPPDWEAVKVYVSLSVKEAIVLTLTQIK